LKDAASIIAPEMQSNYALSRLDDTPAMPIFDGRRFRARRRFSHDDAGRGDFEAIPFASIDFADE